MLTGPVCTVSWLEKQRPGCDTWLRGESETPPDHVCYDIMLSSVEDFCSEHLILSSLSPSRYSVTWPLPIGWRAIARWWKEQVQNGEGIPQPLVTKEDALLGLVACRGSGDDRVWLLGLVEPIPGEEAMYRFAEPYISGPADLWHRQDIKRLVRWYNEILLGKPTGGAPRLEERDDVEEKEKAAREYVALRRKGVKAEVAARRLGYSSKTLERWVKRLLDNNG